MLLKKRILKWINLIIVVSIVTLHVFTINAKEIENNNIIKSPETPITIVGYVNYKGTNSSGEYLYEVHVEASNASDYVKGNRSWDVSVYSNSNQTDQLFSGYVNSFSNYANHVLNVYVGQFTSSSPLYSCYIYVGDNYVYLLNDGAWNSVSNYYGTIYTN